MHILVIEGVNVVFPIYTAFSRMKFNMYQHCLLQHIIQGDQKVSVHLTITVQKTRKNTVF